MACLLGWLQDRVLSAAAPYVEGGVKAVINQVLYVFCLKQFSEELNNEEQELNKVQKEVRKQIEEEKCSTNVPVEGVDGWMKRMDEKMKEVHDLQNEIKEDRRCLDSWSPDWFWRYQKSKEADRHTESIKKLRKERNNFPKLTQKSTLPNIGLGELKGFMSSKASESALRNIMEALGTPGVNMIELHGMPGAGKTTLSIKVREEAKSRKLFDEFLEVTVSQQLDIEKIQTKLAEQLHLEFDENDNTTEKRASRLMLRFQDKQEKLIILDDVWKKLNLTEIWIPTCDNCKVLLTTRRLQACQSMDCQRIVQLDLLTNGEAWNLFKQSACLEDDFSTLIDVAIKVAEECHCLPIAIVSVGHALKGKHPSDWALALSKLQTYEYPKIRDVEEDESAYKCLQLSFDYLQRKETKKCLLLCSLFPEDYEISVEDLTRYAVGLGMFREARSITLAMLEVLGVLHELVESHLLLEAKTEGHVKMHDLVRAVTLWIGRESETTEAFKVMSSTGIDEWPTNENLTNCSAIFLLDSDIRELPDQLDCPKLEMLYFAREKPGRVKYTNVADTCFQRIEKLKVLSLTDGILSLQSLECLTNLQTLELKHCVLPSNGKGHTKFASLRNLKRLEILSFSECNVGDLTYEIGELKNLKLLELTGYCFVEKIPPNVISKLSELEELHVDDFQNWGDKRRENASLMELNSLRHLAILSLTCYEKIPGNFAFCSSLTGYHIHICECASPSFKSRLRYPETRTLCICPREDIINACQKLFGNVHHLHLGYNTGEFQNMMPDMSQMGFQHLSSLDVDGCDMEHLVSTAKHKKLSEKAFSNLVALNIIASNIKEICDGSPPKEFLEKLQTVRIFGCNEMVTIFPAKLLRGMRKLESVTIERCESLQEVFQLYGLDEANKERLSHLKRIELAHLEALTCICKGPIQHVNLKSLTHLIVKSCESLKSLVSPSLAQYLAQLQELDIDGCDQLEHIIAEEDEDGEETSSKAHPQKASTNSQLIVKEGDEEAETDKISLQTQFQTVRFISLRKIRVVNCNILKIIFPITIARSLQLLTELYLKRCNELVAIFGLEDQADFGKMEEMVLPRLLILYLEELPSLIRFCPGGYHFVFPSLEQLTVKACPEMTTSFTAAPDASVHIKPKVLTVRPDTTTQVVAAPPFADGSHWIHSEGNWISK